MSTWPPERAEEVQPQLLLLPSEQMHRAEPEEGELSAHPDGQP